MQQQHWGTLLKTKPATKFLILALLWFWALVVVLPSWIAIINSFKRNAGAVLRDPLALPEALHWQNYVRAWVEADFSQYFINSLLISISCVLLVVICTSMGSYVLARSRSWWSKLTILFLLLGLLVPLRLALAPLYLIVSSLNLADTRLGVALVLSASLMPMACFIMLAYLRSLPIELEQAAAMDGASHWRCFFYVVLPQLRPALATIGLLAFVWSWNEYFFPLMFLQSPDLYPLPLGLATFRSQFAVQWHLMFAGVLIMIAPTIIAFLLASKQLIQGLSEGAIRG